MKYSDMTPAQQFVYDTGIKSYEQGQKDALLSLAEGFVAAGMTEASQMTMEFLNHAEAEFNNKVRAIKGG